MNFLKQFIKLGGLVLVVVILLVGAVFYSIKNKQVEKVYAGAGENVTGFAWSENIGWISFNNTSGGGGTNYGVNIAEDSVYNIGKLSGYAWSENIGWISFNRADTIGIPPAGSGGYDPGNTYNVLAYTDSNNRLQGWARALTACDDNSDGDCADVGEDNAADNAGGWDGWIRFTKTTAPAYGVTLTSGSSNGLFSGYAWGSDVLGWISFSGPTYQVATTFELNLAPNAPSNLNVAPQYCDGRLVFSWTFTDPNLSPSVNQQSKYKIDISYTGFNYSTGEISSGSTSRMINLLDLKDSDSDWYGRTLSYTITVWDNAGNPKSASASSSYGPLSSREYPAVDFSWNPTKIFAMQDVNFLDNSVCYISGNTLDPCFAWSWNIPDATPSTSTIQSPIVQFPSPANVNASLTATDGGTPAYSCALTKPINVNLPLPKIEEKK